MKICDLFWETVRVCRSGGALHVQLLRIKLTDHFQCPITLIFNIQFISTSCFHFLLFMSCVLALAWSQSSLLVEWIINEHRVSEFMYVADCICQRWQQYFSSHILLEPCYTPIKRKSKVKRTQCDFWGLVIEIPWTSTLFSYTCS